MNKKNLILTIIIILLIPQVIIFIIASNKDDSSQKIIKNITSKEAKKMMEANSNNPNLVIIDFRTKDEFNSGYIKNALNIDFYAKDLEAQLNKLDKNKKYLIYCRSGNRSSQALEIMKKLNFKEVYEFGGIIQWQKEGFPVVK